VLRLRKGERARDVAQSRYIFVSRNNLLQRVARRFVFEHGDYDSTNVPPVLTVGQIATIAWFVASKTLEPIKVTKELLANCYNAVRPNTGWAQEFANALDNYKKNNPEEFEARAKSAIFLGAARALAREESLGQTPLLRKVNFAQLLARAAREAEERERKKQDALGDLESAAEARGQMIGAMGQMARSAQRIQMRARRVVSILKWATVSAAVLGITAIYISDESGYLLPGSPMRIISVAILTTLLGISILDLFGLKFATRIVQPVENWATDLLERLMYRLVDLPTPSSPAKEIGVAEIASVSRPAPLPPPVVDNKGR
jgi:hypothetical protein